MNAKNDHCLLIPLPELKLEGHSQSKGKSEMEIKVLASGSSGNCVYINDGVTPLLLDAGIKVSAIQRGLSFGASKLAGCLITHEHLDHAKAVKDMMKIGIDSYMSQGTAEVLKLKGHRLHVIECYAPFEVGSWRILAFEAHHDVPCLGYLLASPKGEKVLYLTDSAYCKFRFSGLTHILIGVNYSSEIIKENVEFGQTNKYLKRRVIQSHMSLDTLLDFFKANNFSTVTAIYLLHGSDTNLDKEEAKRKVQEITGKPVYVA